MGQIQMEWFPDFQRVSSGGSNLFIGSTTLKSNAMLILPGLLIVSCCLRGLSTWFFWPVLGGCPLECFDIPLGGDVLLLPGSLANSYSHALVLASYCMPSTSWIRSWNFHVFRPISLTVRSSSVSDQVNYSDCGLSQVQEWMTEKLKIIVLSYYILNLLSCVSFPSTLEG